MLIVNFKKTVSMSSVIKKKKKRNLKLRVSVAYKIQLRPSEVTRG